MVHVNVILCFFSNIEVAIPTVIMVMMEKKKACFPIVFIPIVTTIPSMIKIKIPTLKEVIFEMNWASRSVPPVLVSSRSIKPMPMPTSKPPKMALIKIGTLN